MLMRTAVFESTSYLLARQAPQAHVCFETPSRTYDSESPSAFRVRLPDTCAEALGELLPLLLCGEESAALVFDQMVEGSLDPSTKDDLQRIADDEMRHQYWLQRLRRALPAPREDVALRARARRFFMRLRHRDAAVHCVRIAALDSAVCLILGKLRSPQSAIVRDPLVGELFARIHRDEAQHVLMARRAAQRLGCFAAERDITIETRSSLIEILSHRAHALDVLGVDPDKLFKLLRLQGLHANYIA